mgnify:CR=1|jgi:hypothetical protein
MEERAAILAFYKTRAMTKGKESIYERNRLARNDENCFDNKMQDIDKLLID